MTVTMDVQRYNRPSVHMPINLHPIVRLVHYSQILSATFYLPFWMLVDLLIWNRKTLKLLFISQPAVKHQIVWYM